MIDLLRTLCSVDGISGYEEEVRKTIHTLAEPYADEIKTDVMGNLYVLKKGEQAPKTPVAVTTTMGEYGFVIDEDGSEGAMKLQRVDGMDVRSVIGKRYHVVRTGAKGIISLVAQHLTGRSGTDSVPEIKEVQFDCGTDKKEDNASYVVSGDTIVYDYPLMSFGENCLRGKALDCRVGCAVLLKLIMEVTPKYDTWFIFTAKTGVENRGAVVAAREIDPSICLSVTACACCDVPMQKEHMVNVKLRHGAAVGIKERKLLFSRRLNRSITGKATAAGIPWQYRTAVVDTSDAGVLQTSASGMEVMAISVPVRGISSANPVAYIPDIDAAYDVAALFVKEVDGQYV